MTDGGGGICRLSPAQRACRSCVIGVLGRGSQTSQLGRELLQSPIPFSAIVDGSSRFPRRDLDMGARMDSATNANWEKRVTRETQLRRHWTARHGRSDYARERTRLGFSGTLSTGLQPALRSTESPLHGTMKISVSTPSLITYAATSTPPAHMRRRARARDAPPSITAGGGPPLLFPPPLIFATPAVTFDSMARLHGAHLRGRGGAYSSLRVDNAGPVPGPIGYVPLTLSGSTGELLTTQVSYPSLASSSSQESLRSAVSSGAMAMALRARENDRRLFDMIRRKDGKDACITEGCMPRPYTAPGSPPLSDRHLQLLQSGLSGVRGARSAHHARGAIPTVEALVERPMTAATMDGVDALRRVR